jgi:hypothetical protein
VVSENDHHSHPEQPRHNTPWFGFSIRITNQLLNDPF